MNPPENYSNISVLALQYKPLTIFVKIFLELSTGRIICYFLVKWNRKHADKHLQRWFAPGKSYWMEIKILWNKIFKYEFDIEMRAIFLKYFTTVTHFSSKRNLMTSIDNEHKSYTSVRWWTYDEWMRFQFEKVFYFTWQIKNLYLIVYKCRSADF